MRQTFMLSIVTGLIAIALAVPAIAQDKSYLPTVAAASNEPDAARQLIRRPKDIDVSLFASEPRLANPVAFTIDERGRFFVVETFRLKAGVTDNRSHLYWLDDDLASKTVADRERMTRKWLGKEAETYAVEHDRIRLIEDRDGDHKADFDTVFADGFNQLSTGIGAGVLARKGDVYFACIPDLWLLKDTKGTGRADSRTVLSTGYGVHVAFLGHDLHGLIMGPDGRLYFSIGDRGLHVVTKEGKTVSCPDTGAVLRCEPDGSNLELFATGLRNPQELAFNNFGDLFTVDNNSDSGDKARVVHLVEGGDSGWRIGYQYIEQPVSRGPWNAEKLWYPAPQNTAAYLLPPLMNLSDGPSGLTFDPGVTLLPDRYKDHFLLADFRGGFGQSGIRSFAVKPKGASYEVVDSTEFAWSVLATDVDFGPDGALYVSDWVDGWDKTGKGRIWRFADPKKEGNKAVKDVQTLIGQGMGSRTLGSLGALLGHADRRVRQAAQFELADRAISEVSRIPPPPTDPALPLNRDDSGIATTKGREAETALGTLSRLAESKGALSPRLHAIWAIGQMNRRAKTIALLFSDILEDADPEVRAQAVRVLGESKQADGPLGGQLIQSVSLLLQDKNPRVQFFAAQALGKLGHPSSVHYLIRFLGKNDDRDPYLRHAAVQALAKIGDVPSIATAARSEFGAGRLGAILALRELGRPEVMVGLSDPEPRNVLEAARAIYDDNPQPGSEMEALASLASSTNLHEPILRRVINANARLGGKERAAALVNVALRERTPALIRVEAFEMLGDWAKPSGRDRITGLWRPFPARPKSEAADALRARLDDLLRPVDDDVRRAAIGAIGQLGVGEAVPGLISLIVDEKVDGATRVDALKAIELIGDVRLREAVARAVDSKDTGLRREGQRLLAKTDPDRAVPMLASVLVKGSTRERQGALAVLATLGRPDADALIASHLTAKDLPGEVELDLLDAAESRKDVTAIKAALDARSKVEPKNDPIAGYRAILLGGDARKGRLIFEKNTGVYCLRCHKVKGEGGEVGPDLTGIGAKQTREYLATSLVHPNAAIAQGFETVVVAMADGKVVSGVFKSEDEKVLKLMSVDNKPIDVVKSDIDERKRGPSAMPEDIVKKLKKSDLRDLVEFLATLR